MLAAISLIIYRSLLFLLHLYLCVIVMDGLNDDKPPSPCESSNYFTLKSS